MGGMDPPTMRHCMLLMLLFVNHSHTVSYYMLMLQYIYMHLCRLELGHPDVHAGRIMEVTHLPENGTF